MQQGHGGGEVNSITKYLNNLSRNYDKSNAREKIKSKQWLTCNSKIVEKNRTRKTETTSLGK